MINETRNKIKDKYLEVDSWLQIHWKEFLFVLVIIFFIFAGVFSKDQVNVDQYDSGLQDHLR